MNDERRETLRYLGYGRNEPDEQVSALVERCLAELHAVATPRSLYRELEVARLPDDSIAIATITTRSSSLTRHLAGCGQVIAFAATLGASVDTLIRRAEAAEMSRAVVLQAAATAVIESYCDSVCDELAVQLRERGLHLRPRFSPGYGDLDISLQRELLTILGAHRIGLGCTDALLLTPIKSVTAILGVGEQEFCTRGGCPQCGKQDCLFRRD